MTDALDGVQAHREDLEALAESDLPVNWVAQELLEAAEEESA